MNGEIRRTFRSEIDPDPFPSAFISTQPPYPDSNSIVLRKSGSYENIVFRIGASKMKIAGVEKND